MVLKWLRKTVVVMRAQKRALKMMNHLLSQHRQSSKEAINLIYEIKGCKLTSPLAICVGDVSDIERFAFTEHLPESLLNALLPGPVTLVLRRGESTILENSLNLGIDKILLVFECSIATSSGSLLRVLDVLWPLLALEWASLQCLH